MTMVLLVLLLLTAGRLPLPSALASAFNKRESKSSGEAVAAAQHAKHVKNVLLWHHQQA
jgi:hypothetical protein